MKNTKLYAYRHKNNLSEEEFETLMEFLSDDEKFKVSRFHFRIDQEISLLSRFLLRQLLASHLNNSPEEIIFSYSEYGRPFLADYDFNVSHAGDWIVIAVASNGRVGVDVEKIRQVEENLADVCFTSQEKEVIFSNERFDVEKFFDFWTLKEAFLKADGRGLSFPLLDFYFELSSSPQINFLKNEKSDKWYFRTYVLSQEYKLAMCRDQENFPGEISFLNSWQEFL